MNHPNRQYDWCDGEDYGQPPRHQFLILAFVTSVLISTQGWVGAFGWGVVLVAALQGLKSALTWLVAAALERAS